MLDGSAMVPEAAKLALDQEEMRGLGRVEQKRLPMLRIFVRTQRLEASLELPPCQSKGEGFLGVDRAYQSGLGIVATLVAEENLGEFEGHNCHLVTQKAPVTGQK